MLEETGAKNMDSAQNRDNYIVNKIKLKNLAKMIVVVKCLINIAFT